jgi:superfamily II DNA or RNA helicase
MKSLKNINIDITYGGFGKNLVESFYKPMLSNSVLYKRSTAFFTGGIFSIAASSIKEFILENDGKIQLVTSTIFNKDYITTDETSQNTIDLLTAIDNLVKYSDGQTIVELIGSLISNKKLEIKIANVPVPGIHHEKVGIFIDQDEAALSFSGSVNETWSGWTVNSEEFKVFKSWDESLVYFKSDLDQFDLLWNNKKQNVEVLSLPEAVQAHILSYLDDPSIERLEQKIDAIHQWKSKSFIQGLDFKKIEIENSNNSSDDTKRQLMKHQSDVLEDWEKNNFYGIIKHATGSGKTFTGINGIKKWLEKNNVAIVLAPSILLLEQWLLEVENELPEVNLVKAGGGEAKENWSQTLRFLTSTNNKTKTVVVSTIGTALTDDFLNGVIWGSHILLLVDEVHNIGSPKQKHIMSYKTGGALGLSATPERYGDAEGTEEILKYFKKILKPEFTLIDAIESGRLVPYIHKPLEVELTEDEEEDYSSLSLKISKLFNLIENGKNDTEIQKQLEILLFARAKIIKKAKNKIPIAVEVIKKDFRDGEHWLLYCQDKDHLKEAREALKEEGIASLEYMSSMRSDRKGTLDYFKDNGGILVAIKCLDEGVDIPYLKNAIILSSSQNPREHIQRRGRVLRKSPEKNLATIYDALVLTTPELNLRHEQVMATEIKRAYNFSKDAFNPEASIEIMSLARKYNIDINDLSAIEDSYKIEEE